MGRRPAPAVDGHARLHVRRPGAANQSAGKPDAGVQQPTSGPKPPRSATTTSQSSTRKLFTGSLGLGVSLQQGWQDAARRQPARDGDARTLLLRWHSSCRRARTSSSFSRHGRRTRTCSRPARPPTRTSRTRASRSGCARPASCATRRSCPISPRTCGRIQQYDKQTTTYGGQSFQQNDRRDQIELGFQNGGETSDLNFQYQYTKLDNYAYNAGSYNSQNANFLYSIDFGPTLNWRSDSRINYYARTGATELSNLDTLDVNEFLTIDHNENFSSNYNYQLTRQDAPVGNATTQSAGAQWNEQVFRNLSLTEGLTAIYSSLPGGTISSVGGSGNFNYGHAVPWEGQLTLAGGGGYLVTTSQVPGGVVPVVDAPYAVPQNIGAGSTIQLRDRNIETPTIVVVVLKTGGVRVTAVLDVDYTVQVEGDLTYLVPLASSALMQPGDPLNVSYVYQVAPNSKFATTSGSASFGIDWPWFGFNYSHDQTDQTPLSGSDRHAPGLRAPRRRGHLRSRHLGRVPGAGRRRARSLRQHGARLCRAAI